MDDYTGPAIYSSAVAVAILCGLAVFLDIPPFIWHARNHNFAAASLVLWVILINLMYFVNAIIWPNDDVATWFSGIILCDIEIKLQVGSWVAIVGSLACIMRNLARVMDTEAGIFVPTKAQRIRQRAVDITLCFGFPVLIIALSCIPQYYRYFLVGINGCVPAFDESWPTIAIIYIWPPILSLVDTYYAGTSCFHILPYQANTAQSSSYFASNATAAPSPRYSPPPAPPNPVSCVFSSCPCFSFSSLSRSNFTSFTAMCAPPSAPPSHISEPGNT